MFYFWDGKIFRGFHSLLSFPKSSIDSTIDSPIPVQGAERDEELTRIRVFTSSPMRPMRVRSDASPSVRRVLPHKKFSDFLNEVCATMRFRSGEHFWGILNPVGSMVL